MKRLLLLSLLILFASPVHAACTGSGTTWSCPAGASVADVQAAINSANDGAVITFARGAYTWSSGTISLSNSTGVTLICAAVGGCTVSIGSTTVIGLAQISGTNNHFYRISGFVFQGGSYYPIWFGYAQPANGVMKQIRVDHNTWTSLGSTYAVICSDNSGVGLCYGVIDHNTLNCPGSCALIYEIGGVNPSPPPNPLGTANNLFIEDNTVTIAAVTDEGLNCTDGWGGAALVIRHNTFTNCSMGTHGATHAGGPENVEVYNNSVVYNSSAIQANGYRQFHHQGSGTILVFNNSFTAYPASSKDASNVISINNYRANPQYDGAMPTDAVHCDGTVNGPADAVSVIDGNRAPSTTWHGYPCWHQAGRDFSLNYAPMYAWNNYWSDTHGEIDLNLDDAVPGTPDYFNTHLQYNREAYNEVSSFAQASPTSPFNGTTG